MIEYTTGNLLESDADLIVIPVNCVGTLGAGLAKQASDRWPKLDREYQKALRSGDLYITHPSIVRVHGQDICLFPTKWHYRELSRVEWIDEGLDHLLMLNEHYWTGETLFPTIAMPKLGCGLGGLTWDVVRPLIEETFEDDKYCTVFVYE